MSEAITFISPPQIAKELDAITELGIYKDKNAFILDAINTLLSSHMELRVSIACKLYENEDFSLGKAPEIVGTSIEDMKKILSDHGIKLKVGTSTSNMKDRAQAVLDMIRGS
jgi:predicted HTH domain antitoxin